MLLLTALILREMQPEPIDHGAHKDDIQPGALPGLPDGEAVEGAERGITTTTGADAAVGAAKGAGIGLGIGALAALASVMVPGIGIVVGGGGPCNGHRRCSSDHGGRCNHRQRCWLSEGPRCAPGHCRRG